MNVGTVATFALIASLTFPKLLLAEEWTAYQIVDHPNGAQSHYLQLKIQSRKLCNMLIKVYFKSVRVDCPSCKQFFKSCDVGVPNGTRQLINNEVWATPYVSQRDNRTWFTGVPRSTSSQVCRKLASQLRSTGLLAQCIE